MSHIDHSNAKPLYKAFHGLYLNLQRSFTECNAVKLNPTVKPVDSWMQLPLPAKMRNQLRSSNGNNTPSMEYFPDEIQHHILNEQSVAVTYKFNMGTRKVVLHFVEFNTHTPDLKKMQAHARSVCALMHLVSMHASRSACSSALNIYMYMTDFKKRFPIKKGEVIDTEHANTGMSYHCSTTNDIVVYRKEEWFKVLIHESFHAFGLSFIENDMPKGVDRAMQTMLQKMYSISHSVRIYETYCEIWARISSGVLRMGNSPSSRSLADKSVSASVARKACPAAAIISGGVAAGAAMENHTSASKPGKTLLIGGTSGASGKRSPVETAMARSRPPAACAMA